VVELHKIKQKHYDPSEKDCTSKSLVKCSLLSITDDFSYTGCEFEHRKVCMPFVATCSLGSKVFNMELCHYRHSYMSSLRQGASQLSITDQSSLPGTPDPLLRTDNRVNYKDIPSSTFVSCAVHTFGIKDKDSPEMW